MAIISLKDISDELHHQLKMKALANHQTLRDYLIAHLTSLAYGSQSPDLGALRRFSLEAGANSSS